MTEVICERCGRPLDEYGKKNFKGEGELKILKQSFHCWKCQRFLTKGSQAYNIKSRVYCEECFRNFRL